MYHEVSNAVIEHTTHANTTRTYSSDGGVRHPSK